MSEATTALLTRPQAHLRPDHLAGQVAAGQHCLITRQQARECGLTDREIDGSVYKGVWCFVAPGVLRIVGCPESWTQSLHAATLSIGDGAFASHTSAGALYRVDGMLRSGEQHVAVTRPMGGWGASAVVHHVRGWIEADATVVEGIPCTAPEMTLMHLASMVTYDRLEECLDSLLRDGQTSMPRLRWRLGMLVKRGRKGSTMMRELIAARQPGYVPTKSILEAKTARLLKDNGLPDPIRQHVFHDAGRHVITADFLWLAERVVVECDGHRGHSPRQRRAEDAKKRNWLESRGFRVLVAWWDDVIAGGPLLIPEIRRALGLDG